ncbi:glycosyltransferase family 4 protein [Gammaproteobacteria bacterium]|nr:glycosyltransferase family 4 protein [Gammaproteobacteria bacterium]
MHNQLPKVLITSNPLDHEGGIANYYKIFFEFFKSNHISLMHLSFGSRMKHFYFFKLKFILYPAYYVHDLVKLILILIKDKNVKIVQVSPSLIPLPLIRDALIILIAKLFKKRVIVFYRGWKPFMLRILKKKSSLRFLFNLIYGLADKSFVLAASFKADLIDLGFNKNSIGITTTMYTESEIAKKIIRSDEKVKILFLGRISEAKGIGDLIDAAKLLKDQGYNFEFTVVGHGDRKGVVESFKKKSLMYGLDEHIKFPGRITGNKKFLKYSESDLFILPSWSEGCPNSVLEALGSGLFVICTNVGALNDVIIEGDNGKFSLAKDYKSLAKQLKWAFDNINYIRERSLRIQQKAKSLYSSDVIIHQFDKEYQDLLYG